MRFLFLNPSHVLTAESLTDSMVHDGSGTKYCRYPREYDWPRLEIGGVCEHQRRLLEAHGTS